MQLTKKIIALFLWLLIATACGGEGENPPVTPTEDEIEVLPGMTLIGRIVDYDKNPIEGAVVSDGYSAVETDASGVYQIKQDEKAEFVFVSVPSEYEIPMSLGLPQIYKKLASLKSGKITRHNFTLKKSKKEKQFTLLAFADVQVGHDGDLDSLAHMIPFVKEYIGSLSSPIYGISVGDLVWDNMPYLDDYISYMTKLNIPIFQVIGNHDFDKNETDEEKYADEFKTRFGPIYYSYNRGDCHFVVLDDVAYQGAGKYDKYISANQLEWLEKDLKYVSKDKLIIIGLHVPTQKRNLSHRVTNSEDLYALLNGYNVRIISGHLHTQSSITISETIEENNLAAFKGAGWTGDLCADGTPQGFGVYQIDGNKIKNWFYKGTRHDQNYQLYVYKPGEAFSFEYRDGLVINIFNWHTNWKRVDVFEDGILYQNGELMKASSNFNEYDRRAYDYMAGGDKPARWKSAEPYEFNDHMYYYKPQKTDWQEIVIEVEDPYGNVYKEIVNKK